MRSITLMITSVLIFGNVLFAGSSCSTQSAGDLAGPQCHVEMIKAPMVDLPDDIVLPALQIVFVALALATNVVLKPAFQISSKIRQHMRRAFAFANHPFPSDLFILSDNGESSKILPRLSLKMIS